MTKFLIAGLFALGLSSVAFAQDVEPEPLVCEPTVEVSVENFVPALDAEGVVIAPADYFPGKSGKSGKNAKWTQQDGTVDIVTTTTVFVEGVDDITGEPVCVLAEVQPEPESVTVETTQYVNPGGNVVYKDLDLD